MKYFLKVLTVLIIAVAVIFGMYYYTNGSSQQNGTEKASLTTVSKAPATEKNSNKTLIASLEQEGFYLYKSNDCVILKHNDNEFEFYNWSRNIDLETPVMYYNNFDTDSDRELIIRAVNSINYETKQYNYVLYILDPKKDSVKEDYNVIFGSHSTWSKILDEAINSEISQLKSCKKIIQLAMTSASKSISYDKATGIAKSQYVGYARALQDSNGNYLTIDKWTRGNGVYSISDNRKICVDVPVNISYKKTDVIQEVGNLHFELCITKTGGLYITEKTLVFNAYDKYKVSDPKKISQNEWSYTLINTDSTPVSTDLVVDWIKYSAEPDFSGTSGSVSFAGQTSDIKSISKIAITQSYIEFNAKSGASFAESIAKRSQFSIIINEGTEDSFDIAYNAELRNEGDTQILRIYFDKAYPHDEIKSITINYGTK